MSHLPVIIGFGGINPAGRSSFHHAFRRIINSKLDKNNFSEVYLGLATMMGYLKYKDGKFIDEDGIECFKENVVERYSAQINQNTLLRKISSDIFDIDRVLINKAIHGHSIENSTVKIKMPKKMLPSEIPSNWDIHEPNTGSKSVEVNIKGNFNFLFQDFRTLLVRSGGQIPTGLDLPGLYKSNHHPRGLQLTIFGASDAIKSMGIDWEEIKQIVAPDKIGVYSCSAMGQLDSTGSGGFSSAFVAGRKTTSKQLAMGLPEMPADFINAYTLGNVGYTSANVGACATTLYNLNIAMKDIRSGKIDIAVVGNSEAPIIPEVIEAYRATSALVEDSQLMKMDINQGRSEPDFSQSCCPFANNFGFVLGEAAQYFVICSDELAFKLGAQVFGSIGDMFINADGNKKSIASPGFGNYICMAKAVASARVMFGSNSIKHRSFIHAHGTGTPQNRVTESHVLNEIAKVFGIEKWPVAAIKCYVGHSLGPASGDQIANALGTWKYGIIPGIFTLDTIADDVYHSNLSLSKEHIEVDPSQIDVAFVNAKGFGGNNATGMIISPFNTLRMIKSKYGNHEFKQYEKRNESVLQKANEYDKEAIHGNFDPIYNFGKNVLDGNDLDITPKGLSIPGFKEKVNLKLDSPYPDMFSSDD